jgi:hypothetical protein
MIKDRKTFSKTTKKRIRWTRPRSINVAGYRLYWSVSGEVSYDSEFVDIANRTEVVLPDQVPSLHHVRGEVAFGITALTHGGNESNIVRFNVHFDAPVEGVPEGLLRPGVEGWEPPARASILVDDLHYWLIKNPNLQEPGQSADRRDYYAESHHVEEARR